MRSKLKCIDCGVGPEQWHVAGCAVNNWEDKPAAFYRDDDPPGRRPPLLGITASGWPEGNTYIYIKENVNEDN